MNTMEKKYILTSDVAAMKLRRMAYEILENNQRGKSSDPGRNPGQRFCGCAAIEELLKGISNISTELITISFDKKHPSSIELSQKLILTIK